jgi:hypothetical protein
MKMAISRRNTQTRSLNNTEGEGRGRFHVAERGAVGSGRSDYSPAHSYRYM